MRTTIISILLSTATIAIATPALAEEANESTTAETSTVAPAETPAGHDTPVKVPEPASETNWTLDASLTFKTGREFLDQGFLFTKNDVVELDVTACNGGLCFNFWRADTKVAKEHETDFQVWYTKRYGKLSIQGKLAGYEVAGPDIGEAKVTVAYQATEACNVAGSYEKIWGGFKDVVVKAKGSCTLKPFDASVQLSHTENFDQWVPGAEVGVKLPLNSRLFVKGYGGRDPAVVGGIAFRASFR